MPKYLANRATYIHNMNIYTYNQTHVIVITKKKMKKKNRFA